MTTISNTTYTAGNYAYANNTPVTAEETATNTGSVQKTGTEFFKAGDKVTFSPGLAAARTRDAMGLSPSGKLKIKDFEAVADNRRSIVESKLAQLTAAKGIDPDQQISLSLDDKYQIRIKESLAGKSDLEKALNEDPEFVLAFKQLSANQSILDYKSGLQSRSRSLADYFSSDTGADDLISMAARLEEIKFSDNKIESLLGLSQQQAPYTYKYKGGTKP